MSAPASAGIPFTKASACGNDFILIEGMHAPADLPAFSRRICDRHDGVGADGVEWMFPDSRKEADIRIRLFNADGSEAEISGNGTRCVAALLAAEQRKSDITIRTGAGLKTCRLVSMNGHRFTFEMNMGEPQVGDEFSIKLASGEVRGIPVSMGNPHFVVFVPEFFPGWQADALLRDGFVRFGCCSHRRRQVPVTGQGRSRGRNSAGALGAPGLPYRTSTATLPW